MKAGIHGHSLVYSLILLIIVSSLMTVLVYGMFWNKVSEQEYVKEHQLEQHLLSAQTLIEQKNFYTDYLNREYKTIIDEDSLTIALSPWGAYTIAHCEAFHGKIRLIRNFMYGGVVNSDTTLELIDHKNPLVLVGQSALGGNLKLPKAGMKYGSIGSKYYTGNKISMDCITPSSTISTPVSEDNEYWKKGSLPLEIIDSNSIKQSFSHETMTYFFSDEVYLSSELSGNVVITSSKSIVVHPEAKLYHTILKAPYIEIQSGFTGILQMISDSVIIRSNCRLEYPSSILSISQNQSTVVLEEDVKFGGSILAHGFVEKLLPIVRLNHGVRVAGEIISNGFLDLKGEVLGKVTTNAFLHRENGSTYINYLVDGTIQKMPITGSDYPGQVLFQPDYLYCIETLK